MYDDVVLCSKNKINNNYLNHLYIDASGQSYRLNKFKNIDKNNHIVEHPYISNSFFEFLRIIKYYKKKKNIKYKLSFIKNNETMTFEELQIKLIQHIPNYSFSDSIEDGEQLKSDLENCTIITELFHLISS